MRIASSKQIYPWKAFVGHKLGKFQVCYDCLSLTFTYVYFDIYMATYILYSWLVVFYGISILVGYLMLIHIYIYIYIYIYIKYKLFVNKQFVRNIFE